MASRLWLLVALAVGCEQSLEIGSISMRESRDAPSPTAAGNAGAGGVSSNTPDVGASGAYTAGGSVSLPAGAAGAADLAGAAGAEHDGSLWNSGFETGDTGEWSTDGAATGGAFLHVASLQASTEQAHGGVYSAKIGFDTSDGDYHWSELYRAVAGGAAYYSAWFYLDAPHTPSVYWTIFNFFSESTPGELGTRHGLWDVNLNAQSLYFYDEGTKKFADASPRLSYPIGRWFQLEAYLDYAPPSASRLIVWLDGTQILERSDLQSPAGTTLYWGIGSQTDALTPSSCTLYIDDAAISRSRVGP